MASEPLGGSFLLALNGQAFDSVAMSVDDTASEFSMKLQRLQDIYEIDVSKTVSRQDMAEWKSYLYGFTPCSEEPRLSRISGE